MRAPPRPVPRRHLLPAEVATLLRTADEQVATASDGLHFRPRDAHAIEALFVAEQTRLLVRLAADTGARRGELATLRLSDLAGRALTIERNLSLGVLGPTKTSRSRRLTIGGTTAAMLVEHFDSWAERVGPGVIVGDWVFAADYRRLTNARADLHRRTSPATPPALTTDRPVPGPVDARVDPQPVEDVDRPATFTLMAPGWRPPADLITQSLGFCFTPDRQVVLIDLGDGFWSPPGGTVEPGERPADTLVREVAEEACARVIDCRYLASQHVWDPQAPTGPTSYYQTRWWARVELDPWLPNHETVGRRLVPPNGVLAALSWDRQRIAGRLLELALAVDQSQRS